MPQTCSICAHAERTALELALATRQPLRAIARQYGVSKDALARHRDNCGAGVVQQAQAARDMARQRTVRAQVEELQRHAMQQLAQAEGADDLRTAILAMRAARENLQLLAKLTGELDERPQVNILVHPDWLALRDRILVALQVHPVALEAVIDAIGKPA